MKVGLISDLHYGITSSEDIVKTIENLKNEQPDVIVNCGDDSGGFCGYVGVTWVASTMRKLFGHEVPILHVMGNHDYWAGPKGRYWARNLRRVKEGLLKYSIISLDQLGHYNINNVFFFGNSGWYSNPNPPTIDKNFMPSTWYRKPLSEFLHYKKTEKVVSLLLDKGVPAGYTPVFVSHFPVINTGPDYKGRFEDFSWDTAFLRDLLFEAGVKHFLCGHSHGVHRGPLRYESGSDYYKPAYSILEIT